MISLHAPLESAIAEALRSLPSSQWISAAQRLSNQYRATRPTDAPLRIPHSALRTQDALGYAALVLPAAYAQLYGALAATTHLLPPDFHPTTLLDLGSGPGTALWAAVEHFPPSPPSTPTSANPPSSTSPAASPSPPTTPPSATPNGAS